jgi:hypothetical protein
MSRDVSPGELLGWTRRYDDGVPSSGGSGVVGRLRSLALDTARAVGSTLGVLGHAVATPRSAPGVAWCCSS